MTNWFIADTHFRHSNILNFENRPFETLDEMENKMIEAWNSVVKKNDKVYIIGDFCFGRHIAWIEILDQLKGEISLVKGNHDKSKIVQRVINENYIKEENYHNVGTLIREGKYSLHLTHYPMLIGETRVFNFNISGHIHSQSTPAINVINVGVDSEFSRLYRETMNLPFGTPISQEYLMGWIEKANEKMNENKLKQIEERNK